MNSIFRFTLLFSLLIHLCVYVALMVDFESIIKKEKVDTLAQSRTFILIPLTIKHKPTKKIQEQKGPSATKKETTPEPARKAISSINSSHLNDLQSIQKPKSIKPINEKAQSKKISELDASLFQKKLHSSPFSILNELDDSALDDSIVVSPLDDIEEQKANWQRDIMHHLKKLIVHKLVKPEDSKRSESGVIEIELDTEGYLKRAWIHLPSGNDQLDTSVLHAVQSVKHYPIPKSEMLNRYFRKLKYYYNGS